MTQFGRPTRSEIVHNCIKSETMHESVDGICIFENLRKFDIKKKFLKRIFSYIKIKLEIHCTCVTSKALDTSEALTAKTIS
jgi:hypothetical protein